MFKKYNHKLRNSINSKILKRNFTCLKNPNYYTYALLNGDRLMSLIRNISIINHKDLKRIFDKFLWCIFYIGKGTRNRKISHLQHLGFLSRYGRKPNQLKARKILETWNRGEKVAIIQLCTDTNHFEALSNESAAIQAIGLENLMNYMKGTPYGVMATNWTKRETSIYGLLLLYNALIKCIYENPPLFEKKDIYSP